MPLMPILGSIGSYGILPELPSSTYQPLHGFFLSCRVGKLYSLPKSWRSIRLNRTFPRGVIAENVISSISPTA